MGDAKVGPFLPGARVTCVTFVITRGQSPFLIGLRRLVQFQRSLLGVLGHEVRSLAREARGHHAKWFNCCGPGTRQAPASLQLGARARFLRAVPTRKLRVCRRTARYKIDTRFMDTHTRVDGATVYGNTTPKRATPSYLPPLTSHAVRTVSAIPKTKRAPTPQRKDLCSSYAYPQP